MVICDNEEKAESLLKNKEKRVTPTLSCLVLFNPFSATLLERGRKCGVEILQLSQIMVRNITEQLLSFSTILWHFCSNLPF